MKRPLPPTREQIKQIADRAERRSVHYQDRKPPDLQTFITEFGTYSNITPEGWARYEHEMQEYQNERRERLFFEQANNRANLRR